GSDAVDRVCHNSEWRSRRTRLLYRNALRGEPFVHRKIGCCRASHSHRSRVARFQRPAKCAPLLSICPAETKSSPRALALPPPCADAPAPAPDLCPCRYRSELRRTRLFGAGNGPSRNKRWPAETCRPTLPPGRGRNQNDQPPFPSPPLPSQPCLRPGGGRCSRKWRASSAISSRRPQSVSEFLEVAAH